MWQAEEVAGARVAGVGFTVEDGEKLFLGGQWVVHTADRPSRGQRRGRMAHPEPPSRPGLCLAWSTGSLPGEVGVGAELRPGKPTKELRLSPAVDGKPDVYLLSL